MKKIVVLLVFFVFSHSWAQDFKIGLTLAPTINFNKNEIKVDDKWKTTDGSGGLGWKGGLLADYRFAGNYYVHSGFLIHSKSFDTDAADMKVTTLEIPLALKLRTKEVSDNVHITGFFGTTFDLNVAAKVGDYDAKDEINTFGMSFMAGAGAEYDLDFGSIGLGLSYHLGFTDVSNSDLTRITPKHLSIDLVFYF
jgi:hypothetical protein